MNDEETAALIVGGHTLGKTHGAGPDAARGPGARGRPMEQQGLGWKMPVRHRQGRRHDHQRASRWPGRTTPTKWSNGFLEILLRLRVGADHEPARAPSSSRPRTPRRSSPIRSVVRSASRTMLVTDLALRVDPSLRRRSPGASSTTPTSSTRRSPRPGTSCCTATWVPSRRYLGPWVAEPQLWQDPVPAVEHELIGDADITALKAKVLDSGLSVLAAGHHGVGVGGELPRHRQARRRQRRPDSPGAAAKTGRSTSRPSWPRCCRCSRRSSRSSTAAGGSRCRWPT